MAEVRERCVCLTKQGTRCKNTATVGSVFCWRHQKEGCAKQMGELSPKRRAPSPPRRVDFPKRSPSPRSPRTAAPTSTAHFDQLDDATLQVVCDKLAEQNDYRGLARLIGSGKRFRSLCQASLNKLEEPPTEIDEEGDMFWRNRAGQLHRTRDKPARIRADGRQAWFLNGQRHRGGDKPAYIGANGTQMWYANGQLHRTQDKPAVIWANGTQMWYVNDQLHREGDQPARIWADGRQAWYVNGRLHREGDMPAVIYPDGTQEWWVNGRRIR